MLLLVALVVIGVWTVKNHPVAAHEMQKIQIGMSAEEVRKILGPPNDTYINHNGSAGWVYGIRIQTYHFYIDFSNDGKVERFFEDD